MYNFGVNVLYLAHTCHKCSVGRQDWFVVCMYYRSTIKYKLVYQEQKHKSVSRPYPRQTRKIMTNIYTTTRRVFTRQQRTTYIKQLWTTLDNTKTCFWITLTLHCRNITILQGEKLQWWWRLKKTGRAYGVPPSRTAWQETTLNLLQSG